MGRLAFWAKNGGTRPNDFMENTEIGNQTHLLGVRQK